MINFGDKSKQIYDHNPLLCKGLLTPGTRVGVNSRYNKASCMADNFRITPKILQQSLRKLDAEGAELPDNDISIKEIRIYSTQAICVLKH